MIVDKQETLDFNEGAQEAIKLLASKDFAELIYSRTYKMNDVKKNAFIDIFRELADGRVKTILGKN